MPDELAVLEDDDEALSVSGMPTLQLAKGYSICCVLSLTFALADICASATTMMQLNVCSTDDDNREFIAR